MTEAKKRTKKTNTAAAKVESKTTTKKVEQPVLEKVEKTLPGAAYVRSESTNGLIYDTGRYKRVWREAGSRFKITRDELEEVYSSRVGKSLFDSHKLVVESPEIVEYLGVSPRHADYDLYLNEIEDLLLNDTENRLEEVLQYCNDNTLENIVRMTLALGKQLSRNTIFLVGDYSGYELLTIIEDADDEDLANLIPNDKPEIRKPRQRRSR